MKNLSETQKVIINLIHDGKLVPDYDNDGQIVIYTGVWEDEDGNLHRQLPTEED